MSHVTKLLPEAETNFALAKTDPDFKAEYLEAVLYFSKDTAEQIEQKFNKADHHVLFLRDVGVIGQDTE